MLSRSALVCGAGGFIGSHLVKRLKAEGYFVRGVDLKYPEFSASAADVFWTLDLRDESLCRTAVADVEEVYQLAADMGGMGFIHAAECDIMRNNALININMTNAAAMAGVKRYLFSSSACVYRDMDAISPEIDEEEAYPAFPDNEYGWEKLYAERLALTYGRRSGAMAVRVARFQNCYGPEGTWQGGREKAPAAICRKVALARDGGEIEIWGDGTAMRSYTYVDDLVDGIFKLMHSAESRPTNIGSKIYHTVRDLVRTVATVAGKDIRIKYVPGPVGVKARNHSNGRIKALGWEDRWSLEEGIAVTYPWVAQQVERATLATVA
jgi:GDP-D-mannose 3', 5'-epimerase